jgi:hypothetical protein
VPGGKGPGPSIKNPKLYEKLKEKGYDKESAARISNALHKHKKRKRKMKKSELRKEQVGYSVNGYVSRFKPYDLGPDAPYKYRVTVSTSEDHEFDTIGDAMDFMRGGSSAGG